MQILSLAEPMSTKAVEVAATMAPALARIRDRQIITTARGETVHVRTPLQPAEIQVVSLLGLMITHAPTATAVGDRRHERPLPLTALQEPHRAVTAVRGPQAEAQAAHPVVLVLQEEEETDR